MRRKRSKRHKVRMEMLQWAVLTFIMAYLFYWVSVTFPMWR